MTKLIRPGLSVALAVVAAGAPAAVAAPVSVDLRVEGSTRTLFDGPVTTDGHVVSTTAGGAHACDGTNGGANPTPGPTATAALDDGAKLGGFDFDGAYDLGFDDFLISRIGPDTGTIDKFWGLFVNTTSSTVGGCQQRVAAGDEVLWAYSAFGAPQLRLNGPGSARTGETFSVRVTNAETGAPEPGAAVSGALTGADGNAGVTFADAGIYRLKADRADAIRSNTLAVCVDPPGAEPCTSTDKAAPSLDVNLPGRRLASERGRSRTLLVSWQADDAAGAGVSHYAVDVRQVGNGLRASQAEPGEWTPIVERTTLTGVHFRGKSGRSYQFRITAVDRAANRASVETDPLLLPVDDRDRGLWRLSRGWKRIRNEQAWGRTVVRARREGATATFRFHGRRVSLVGRKLRNGGRLRATLDGRATMVRLRGRSGPRSLVWTSRTLRDRRHVLRLRSLGGGPVELDAVAPRP
jgi:hypothetical protein